MSTNYEVVQAQRDFADAQNNELRAILNYRKALVNFETVQTCRLARRQRGGHRRRHRDDGTGTGAATGGTSGTAAPADGGQQASVGDRRHGADSGWPFSKGVPETLPSEPDGQS